MTANAIPSELGQAHQRFLDLVRDVRPELHRYCARMTGSIIDGEDIVQDTLAKAFYALAMSAELPPLRPWLFRVAHNASIDFLRRHDRSRVTLAEELPDSPGAEDAADPDAVRSALVMFLALPPLQRSAVILKDVLGHSADEVAEILETTVPAVKAALVRGRQRLKDEGARDEHARETSHDAALERYVGLFNAGDWDGLRALLADEVRLDLVSKAARKGKAVGAYFGRYAAEPDVRLELGTLEGRRVLWAFTPRASSRPRYFIELVWTGDRVSLIRDFRYVPYIADELELAEHQ
jgi:RNA polymerase sigma factor (sigma-70 family)